VRFYKAARTAVNIFRQHFARDHILGSARVSRVGEACPEHSRRSVAPKQSFLKAVLRGSALSFRIETDRKEVREPETASPARETRVLPNYRATGRGGGVGRVRAVGFGLAVGLGLGVIVGVAVGVGVDGW
jgi:hypothetical protein